MQSLNRTIGTLPYWESRIDASQTIRDLLDLLNKNVEITGVLVLEQNKLIGLLPREVVYEKLGQPFGIELFLKNTAKQFYKTLGIFTLVLPSETLIEDAIKEALMREAHILYEPLVVSHPNGYRVISMYNLLMAQQNTLRELYFEVHHLSTKDTLTLANNRRGFSEIVTKKMALVREFDLDYAVLMIDIDHFKRVNDRYGHLVGDEVLKSVARQIAVNIREQDVLGRFGGEEFVVFLMDISRKHALRLAERVRSSIASFFHTINGLSIHVTISIGVSAARGSHNTLERLYTEADQALYVAKNSGRNKVMQWKKKLVQRQKENHIEKAVVSERINATEEIRNQTLQGLLRMVYLRDYETESHTVRVSLLAWGLAKKLGLSEEECGEIRIGALLHDIGKIAIPDKILFKQAKLTAEEWAIMQKHPEYAHELLSNISYFQNTLDIPYCHHEHWNGKGYPRGLRGDEIPLAARIFTIVDVWDALTSNRPYRAAWKENDVKDYFNKKAGSLFDPKLLPAFFESLVKQ